MFDFDHEELKRCAAQVEKELNETAGPGQASPAPRAPDGPASEEVRTAAPASVGGAARGWAEYVTPPRHRPWVHLGSYLLTVLSLLLPLLAGQVLFGSEAGLRASARVEWYATAGFWLRLAALGIVIPLALSLYAYSRRLRCPSAMKVMRRDPRPPVLLLRAFDDDHAAVESHAPWGSWRQVAAALGFDRPVSFEEMLRDTFSTCGPMVAIGRPGEAVPPLGAARLWIGNGPWEEAVEGLLAGCGRVVLIMGRLQGRVGLRWEAERVCRLAEPARVVLVMPPVDEDEARARWEEYRLVWGDRLPPYEGGELAAVFDGQGRCTVARARRRWGEYDRDEPAYRKAVPAPRRWRLASLVPLALALVLAGRPLWTVALNAVQAVREVKARAEGKNNLRQIQRAQHVTEKLAQPLPGANGVPFDLLPYVDAGLFEGPAWSLDPGRSTSPVVKTVPGPRESRLEDWLDPGRSTSPVVKTFPCPPDTSNTTVLPDGASNTTAIGERLKTDGVLWTWPEHVHPDVAPAGEARPSPRATPPR